MCGGHKKRWVSNVEEVNKCLLMWFRQQLSNHVPVDGGLLKMKAMEFGQQLQIEVDFSAGASNGELSIIKVSCMYTYTLALNNPEYHFLARKGGTSL